MLAACHRQRGWSRLGALDQQHERPGGARGHLVPPAPVIRQGAEHGTVGRHHGQIEGMDVEDADPETVILDSQPMRPERKLPDRYQISPGTYCDHGAPEAE